MGETGNTANPLHVLQTYISKDSHGHNPHGVDETCVRLRYANRTYTGSCLKRETACSQSSRCAAITPNRLKQSA